jgi:hypothetical protein
LEVVEVGLGPLVVEVILGAEVLVVVVLVVVGFVVLVVVGFVALVVEVGVALGAEEGPEVPDGLLLSVGAA